MFTLISYLSPYYSYTLSKVVSINKRVEHTLFVLQQLDFPALPSNDDVLRQGRLVLLDIRLTLTVVKSGRLF